MRLKLVLKIVEGTVLPCNYMYELSSCLYKVLNEGNPVFTAWLHDKGYCKEKKAFKLFTFSNFYFPCFRIEGDRIFVLADTAQLIVSFYPIEAIDAFVMGLFKNRQLEVGDRKSRVRFEVFNLERQAEPEFTSRMFFKTLSPMFIEEQLPETRKAIHLSPGNPKFAELLHLNLLDKYRVFYGQEPDPSWPLTRLHLLSEPKPKTIVLKVAGRTAGIIASGLRRWFRTIEQPGIRLCGSVETVIISLVCVVFEFLFCCKRENKTFNSLFGYPGCFG